MVATGGGELGVGATGAAVVGVAAAHWFVELSQYVVVHEELAEQESPIAPLVHVPSPQYPEAQSAFSPASQIDPIAPSVHTGELVPAQYPETHSLLAVHAAPSNPCAVKPSGAL